MTQARYSAVSLSLAQKLCLVIEDVDVSIVPMIRHICVQIRPHSSPRQTDKTRNMHI